MQTARTLQGQLKEWSASKEVALLHVVSSELTGALGLKLATLSYIS